MSVSDARSRSTSVVTTCSLSFLCTSSPPSHSCPPFRAGTSRGERKSVSSRLGRSYAPKGRRLSLATGWLRKTLGLGERLLELGRDLTRPRRVDVDAGPHRARQRDRAQVAPLRRSRLGAHDLLYDRRIVLQQ